MKNLRKYGTPPYTSAILHGGPGARGEMSPVARELAHLHKQGILEPLQSESTVSGQVEELHKVIIEHAELPITLIGWSWGAWLGFIFTARYPALVKKLILIGCPPFENKYAKKIMKTRMDRLSNDEKSKVRTLLTIIEDPEIHDNDKHEALGSFREIIYKADSFAPTLSKLDSCEFDYDFEIYRCVWSQADRLRRSGELLRLGTAIVCPVVAIHGDYDPHPTKGVKEPLSRTIANFRFILLKECGHQPWLENTVKDRFYEILVTEIVP